MPEDPATRFADVRWFDELDSTNRYALDEAASGAAEGLVVVADHQLAGRGRRDRVWQAPPGSSLLASVLLRPSIPVPEWHVVVAAAALALREALRSVAGVTTALKWPNDLVVDDRKLAGLLAESTLGGEHGDALVVGVGCNVDWPELPDELAESATACNLLTGRAPDRSELLTAFLSALERRYATLEGPDGRSEIRREERAASATIGRPVRVVTETGVLEGDAVGITERGALVLDRAGEATEVDVGDVVHLRPAAEPPQASD